MSQKDILINGPIKKVHPVRFESINKELIRRAAIKKIEGVGGGGGGASGGVQILPLLTPMSGEGYQ